MNLLDLIRRRRSQRADLLDTPISDDHIAALTEAARWAPSPFNIQPWELLFVADSAQKAALGRVTRECIVEQMKQREFLEAAARWTRTTKEEWEAAGDGVYIADQLPDSSFARTLAPFLMKRPGVAAMFGKLGAGSAPGRATETALAEAALICVVLLNRERVSPGDNGEMWTLFSIGAMFQNLLLAATERNIGAQFVCAALETPDGRDRVRRLFNAPETREPVLILRVGYLKDDGEIRSVRLPPEQITRSERYDSEES